VCKISVAITCDASGDASETVVGVAYGKLVGVGYAPGTLATGVDITVKDEGGAAILTLTNAGTSPRYFRPTNDITTNAGVAVTDGANNPNTNRDIFVAGKVKVVAAQGGNLGAGAIQLVFDETVVQKEAWA
jgi:hypothetical protein